jgi:hypothetical protein
MPEVELLATGEGEYRLRDPDDLRVWVRDRKRRDLVDRTTWIAAAVDRLVADKYSVLFDGSSVTLQLAILRGHGDPARTVIGRTAKS